MDKNSKILIIGFGSIGRRHYDNVRSLGFKRVYVYDSDNKKTRGQPAIQKITPAALRQFTAVLICTPNYLHIKQALLCAQAGCHLFIEKPLAHALLGISKLQALSARKKLVVMVGCNMRFHPCLRFIKQYIKEKRLGKIYHIQHEFGHYLPAWRPGTDYRKNYATRKSTGGGIVLDAIHEFDLLFWLNDFNKVKEHNLLSVKISSLTIDTKDACLASFLFQNKVLGSVACDYLQRAYTRKCKITGEKGNLEWDFNTNIIWLATDKGKKKLLAVKKYDKNKMYVDELRHWFACMAKRQKPEGNLLEARTVLSYLLN